MSTKPRWPPSGKRSLFNLDTDNQYRDTLLQSVDAASNSNVTNYPNLGTDASVDSIYDPKIGLSANERGHFFESSHNVSSPASNSSIAAYARPNRSTSFNSPSFAPSSNYFGHGGEVGMPYLMVHEPRCLQTPRVRYLTHPAVGHLYDHNVASIQDVGVMGTFSSGAEPVPIPSTYHSRLYHPAELPTFSTTYTGSCQSTENDTMNSHTSNASSNGSGDWGPFDHGSQPQPQPQPPHPYPQVVPRPGLTPSLHSQQLAPQSSQWAPSPLEEYNMNLTISSLPHRQVPQPPIEPLRAPDMLIGEQDRNGIPIPGALWQDIFKCYWHDGRCGAVLHRKSYASYQQFLKSIFSHLGAHVGKKDEHFHCRWQGCRFECNAEKVKNERDRIRHVLTHLGPRWRYLCVKCGKTYSRRDTRTQKHTCHPKPGVPSPEACNGMTLAHFWACYGDDTANPCQ